MVNVEVMTFLIYEEMLRNSNTHLCLEQPVGGPEWQPAQVSAVEIHKSVRSSEDGRGIALLYEPIYGVQKLGYIKPLPGLIVVIATMKEGVDFI